jgi:serine/threonine protein phosphatase 1
VEEELQLQLTDQLFLLGDYIDRGPDTKGVLDYIMALQDSGYKVSTLMGNHEDMMLQAMEGSAYLKHWFRNGGQEAVASFGVKDLKAVPDRYWHFLQQLDFYIELDDYLLVHAGFDFDSPHPFTNHEAMLWIRDFHVDEKFTRNKTIVHGHTPTQKSDIEEMAYDPGNKVINIDAGCVYKRVPGLGNLVALDLDTRDLHYVPNCD